MQFSKDDQILASGGYDNKILLWGLNNNSQYSLNETLEEERHNSPIHTILFSEDDTKLISASDLEIIVWDKKNNYQFLTIINS